MNSKLVVGLLKIIVKRMSETAEVRLVRCPKCENLLPEVTGYSVYRCGGCGAVLRGDKGVDLDSFSEKSDDERVAMMKEKYLDKYEKNNSLSDKRMEGQGDGMSTVSSSSRDERTALRESVEYYGDGLMDRENMWEHDGEKIQGRHLDELGQASVAREFENLTLCSDDENGLRRLDQAAGGRNGGRRENSNFLEERGSSNLVSRPGYDHEFKVKNRIDVDGFYKDGYVGDDRPEILRGLYGRKDRLSRYGDLNDRGKEKAFLDRPIVHEASRSGSEDWYPNRFLGVNSSSGQYSYLDARFNRPSIQSQFPEPSLMHRLEMDGDGFSPSRYPLRRVQEYEGPLRSQMLRRGPFQMPPPYQQPLSHPDSSGSYRGDGRVYLDPFEPYHPNDNHHHPSCSCFRCSIRREVPRPVAFSDKFSDVSADTMFNHHQNPGLFSPQDHNLQALNHHPLRSHNPLSHTRWSSDVNSEVDGFILRRPPRMHSTSAVQHCRPMCGGAPFFVCFNCFELLLLPKNVATKSTTRNKIRCGVCSIVIVFAFSNNKLVLCDDAGTTTDSPVKFDDNSNLSPTRGELYMRGHLNQAGTTFSSDDYDNTGYDFESMDREPEQRSPGRGRVNDSSEDKHQNSKSTHTIKVEKVTESVDVPGEDSKLPYQQETMNEEPPPPVGSSLQEYFEYSNKFHVKNPQEAHEKYFPRKTTRKPSAISNLSAATETDVSSNEFSNTGTSFGSDEASRKGRRASESFFAGIVKKSFKEFSRSNQNTEKEKADVTINGHPMPNGIIKKAEEVAGPIHPGDYWYDYRAGFWGVMGGPCLGIIPPCIEEFNHPMPEKCAGGNTGIYVNCRELNQKDLSLLKRRGLPTDRNRSYALEISGRVIDEDTGEELKSLGKLAPTMERLQRGFGMRIPKSAPRS